MYSVLIVSIDKKFLESARTFLPNLNPNIKIVCTYDQDGALKAVTDSQDIDVIVCDHDHEKLDSLALFEFLSRNRVELPYIIVSKEVDGEIAIRAFEERIDYYMSRDKNKLNVFMELAQKITFCVERKQQEYENELNQERMKALIRLAKLNGRSFEDILDYALSESVRLTESQIGYVATYDSKNRKLNMLSWSNSCMESCKVKNVPMVYDLDTTGLWGEPIRRGETVIVNDYIAEKIYPKRGTPMGHLPLNKLLMIPIYHDGALVATAGVANKKRDYTWTDEKQLTLLMDGLFSIYAEMILKGKTLATENKLRNIIDSAPIGMLVLNSKLDIILCNSISSKLIGCGDASNQPGIRFFQNNISKEIQAVVNSVIIDGNTHVSLVPVRNQATGKDYMISVSSVKDIGADQSGYVVTFDDVSELNKTNSIMREAVEHINTLDKFVTEDILRSLKGIKEAMVSVGGTAELEINCQLNNINEAVGFVRDYHNVGMIDPIWQDVSVEVERAMDIFNVPKDLVKIRTDGLRVLADPAFYNVFYHLFSNSIMHGEHVSEIIVKYRIDRGNLILIYRDNGIGLSVDTKDNIVKGKIENGKFGMFLVGSILAATKFTLGEVGFSGKGVVFEITIPPENYSIN
ncbi:MAG: GAF domain-containing protein [Candidatus Methanomethylophilaceae archaeon]|nr:GAF domain-containing protein [Candidatus Methanomethylophilaceae archaeon]MDD3378975.1 GAF domain-containing protein [Candidatus Methanomethylophilaceae archaeon]MDY0225151.1 GAF domain-containing protein [Candidatus Methanomethylophilaceae archaeon]